MTSLPQQIERVRAEYEHLPAGLRRHVQRVVDEARDLAVRWDLDPDRVELAAWGHDLFRAHPPAEQLRLAAEAGIPITPADRAEPVLLHGPIAAIVLRERFRITDDEALAAVRDHTLGAAEMPLIAKVILLADKFEPRKRRRDPVLRQIRRLARRDLDTALLCWADWKWIQERTHGWASHPAHWEARRRWVAEHHLDRALPPILPREPADPDFPPAE
jgi:predicted HD superfamily hydrolase involved in NAD metabolism